MPVNNDDSQVIDLEKLSKFVVVGYDPQLKRDVMAVAPGMSLQDLGGFIGVAVVGLINGLLTQHGEKKK